MISQNFDGNDNCAKIKQPHFTDLNSCHLSQITTVTMVLYMIPLPSFIESRAVNKKS